MRVILSKQCLYLTGMLRTDLGYHIVQRKDGFCARRNSKGSVPPDGHIRFIFICAELAQGKLYIADIKVSGYELKAALTEACFFHSADLVDVDHEYNADEVLQFKKERGL